MNTLRTFGSRGTVLVLGAPVANAAEAERLAQELAAEYEGSPVVEAVIGMPLEAAVAGRLGFDGIAIVAVRPDRFVGLCQDGSDPRALRDYVAALRA